MERNFDSWSETTAVRDDCKDFRNGTHYPEPYKTIVKTLYRTPRKIFSATFFNNAFGVPKATVRECIRHARLLGHPFCANGLGYWYDPNPERLMEHAARLEARAKDMLVTAARERRTAERMATRKMWQRVSKDGQFEMVII